MASFTHLMDRTLRCRHLREGIGKDFRTLRLECDGSALGSADPYPFIKG